MAPKFTADDVADYDDYYEEDEEQPAQQSKAAKKKNKKKAIGSEFTLVDIPNYSMTDDAMMTSAPTISVAPTVVSSRPKLTVTQQWDLLHQQDPSLYPLSSRYVGDCMREAAATGSDVGSVVKEHLTSSYYPSVDSTSSSPASTVFVVIGHVDASKSTLMAQMTKLWKRPDRAERKGSGLLGSPKSSSSSLSTKDAKKASFRSGSALAWEMDVGSDERQHGVTIEAKSVELLIQDRKFVAIDVPGHRDFVPSMLQGAMQADCALLVIDSGKFDSGFSRGGQTKEHLALIRALGISQVIVVFNKIDLLMDEFNVVSSDDVATMRVQLEDYIYEELRFGRKSSSVSFVSVSALKNDNIESLLKNALLSLKPKNHGPPHHSLCVPVVDVVVSGALIGSPVSCCSISGRIEAGSIQNGEKLMVLPSKQIVTCQMDGERLPLLPGDFLNEIRFSDGVSGNSGSLAGKIAIGSVLVDPTFPLSSLRLVEKFCAKILVLNDDNMPLVKGQSVAVVVHTTTSDGYISKLVEKLADPMHAPPGLGNAKKIPKCLVKGDQAIVEITVASPIVVEPNVSSRVTGRVVLRDRGVTVAAGLVIE